MKKNYKEGTMFIILAGIIILCIFAVVIAINIMPNKKNDSYYVKVEDEMAAKIESLEIKDNKLKITMSGDAVSYCAKSTRSTPSENAICWKDVENNMATISIYQYKKYYVWVKDTNGNISIPMSINTKE